MYIGQAEPATRLTTSPINKSNESLFNSDYLPEHVVPMFNNSSNKLNAKQKKKFRDLLVEFQTVFAKNDFDLGCIKGVEQKNCNDRRDPCQRQI